ncbi:hypothetical protein LJC34_00780 [Oscillospiraceae bacterium OttesenSCG-928-G22]|nr:hypothetical protein [Oscillospiraceae bacterium OttesenSCG-928-G22]
MDNIIKSVNARIVSTEPIINEPPPKELPPDDPAEESRDPQAKAPTREELEAEYEQKKKRLRREHEKRMEEAELRAEKLLESANAEAEAIREAARIESERDAAERKAEAERQGYGEGLQKAEAEMEELFSRAQAEIDDTLSGAFAEKEAILKSCENEIFSLSIQIAEKILDMELDRNDAAFLSLAQKALLSTGGEKHVTLRVNPSEYVRFFKTREISMNTKRGTVTATVENDPSVEFSGLLIETDSGDVDAGLKTQLSQIENELRDIAGESHD